MIRYLIHRPTTDGKVYAVIAGLSTDAKPTAGLITGSRFVAADTGTGYMFDETAGQWHESQQLTDAVQAWLDDHPEAIDQAAIEAMFGDQLDGIEEDLGGLKSAISDVNGLSFNVFEHTEWVVGGLSSSGGDASSGSTYRANNYFEITDDITEVTIYIDSGFKYYPVIYDATKTAISTDKQAWGTGEKQYKKTDFPGMKYFRVAMRRDDNTIQTGDYSHIHGYIVNSLYGLVKDVESIPYIENVDTQKFSDGLAWVVGSINSSGGNSSSTTVIKTNCYVDISKYSRIRFQLQSGYKFGWHFYNSSKTHIQSASSYVTSTADIDVPEGAYYLRVNLTDNDGSTADLAWASQIAFYGFFPIVEQVRDATERLNSLFGIGDKTYTGEKIKLTQDTAARKCSIELWKSYTLAEFSDIADYKLYANQSMAIYNGYVFLLGGGGTVAVVDYSTKALVYCFTTSLIDRNHQNSAQFSDYFYDSSDTYPLLFVGRCGNASSGTGDDTCLVYRVQQSGTSFSFTLINTITTDITTHGNSWGIDVNARTISMVGYVNDVYSVTTDNPICMFQWKMPTKAEIISGNTIMLARENCTAVAEIEHEMLQSICSYAGNVFVGIVSNSKNYVYVVNIEIGRILSIVPLISTREVEGVAVYDGKMYVSHKNVNDTTGTNPLWIYELEF